ncbi:hypothetical protein G6011_03087 [Alternaria panax]|uniref:Uncharacterized protein n=1 Tax=Alternaria panax TaxID=48097 RepID=A0AAD4IEF1_9PLEO|nr:hypothetical protein G6011_03087 [Alternaria panax]
MSLFNNDCSGVWDGSFKIVDDRVIWTAEIHPAIIFFNFLLPADHMTDNILPLLQARNLLGGVPLQVAAALNEEYRDARTFLAPMFAADIAYLILFLARKRADLERFELLWCAVHAAVQINHSVGDRYRKVPRTIRERVKRDAIQQFRCILHNPQFNFVGPLLGHALRALEVYIRPLVTDSSPFVWVHADFLHGLHDIHDLSLDGAKARRTLFDYLQNRHPGVETLWHSLLQMYNTHDVTHFPEYGTQPMSKPSLVLWELFYRHAREDVPLEYPQARPSALTRKDNPLTLQGPVDEGKQKKSKNKKKNKSKGGRVVALVEDQAVPKQPPSHDQPVPEVQPASQQQPSAATVEILQTLPTVQEPPEQSEQKPSKKDRRNMKKKLKKLGAAERTKPSVVEERQPSVTCNGDDNGGNATGNKDDTVANNDGDSIIGIIDDDDDVCLTPVEDPADKTSVNEDSAQEDTSDEKPAAQNGKTSVANVYAGILAEKRTPRGSGGGNSYTVEDHAKILDSWQKVGVRKDMRQKQKQHKNDRNIGRDVPNATGHVPTGARSLPVKVKPPVPSAKALGYDAKPRPTKMKALMPFEMASVPKDNNVARDQPTSWSALFKGSRDEGRRPSSQHFNVSTNTADIQLLAITGTNCHGSIQKDIAPLNRSSLVRLKTPIDRETSKGSAAHSTTALPPPGDDDVPVHSSAVRETDVLHVEQWLTSKYASALVGLTEAETRNAHWRPEQSNVTVIIDRFTFYRRDIERLEG